jgi:cytochrome c-type biogenesis protein CcmH
MKRLLLLLAAVACMGAAADPAERLVDPVAEHRAKALFSEIRCLVCQNESIDDSLAPLAADLRRIVREQVSAGRSDKDVLDFLTARYGAFVLLKPPFDMGNALLWLGPFLLVLGGLGGLAYVSRRRETAAALSPEEERRLQSVLDQAPD